MTKIDTEVRHVTKPGSNLFEELGFDPEEAVRHQRESNRKINDIVSLKEELMQEVSAWIKDNNLKQEEAAKILHVTRPRVSDVVNRKTEKFTLDALVNMLTQIGKPVRLSVG